MCNFNQIIVIIQDFNYPTRITCVISVEIVITEIKDIILILRIWSKRVHENACYVTRQITLTTMIISKWLIDEEWVNDSWWQQHQLA